MQIGLVGCGRRGRRKLVEVAAVV
eukprot:COSAG06_NODE_50915_length_315_cov_0.958333_2_plen_23_part_01